MLLETFTRKLADAWADAFPPVDSPGLYVSPQIAPPAPEYSDFHAERVQEAMARREGRRSSALAGDRV
jgi:hypothetical protein